MLPPVGAVSALSAALEKQAIATAEGAEIAGSAPAAILSNPVSAGVEGRLNLLLVAARDRMFDSLLAAIDAVSEAMNLPRQPDESDGDFAQRLAVSIRELTPKQLDTVQRALDLQVEVALPLSLVAEALDDPSGPEAARLGIALQAALPQEPDAVIKAVVDSYGQNAGRSEPSSGQAPVPAQSTPANADAAPISVPAQALQEAVSQPAPPPAAATPAGTSGQVLEPPETAPSTQAQPAEAAKTMASDAKVPNSGVAPTTAQAEAAASRAAIVPPAAAAANEESATAARSTEAGTPTEPGEASARQTMSAKSPSPPPPVAPREIQQIRADIQEGLKVVFGRSIAAGGQELLQIMADSEQAEKIIAQPLISDGLDREELHPAPTAINAGAKGAVLTAPLFGSALSEEASSVMPRSAAMVDRLAAMAAPVSLDVPDVEAQLRAALPAILGVPFAIAPYQPAGEPVRKEAAPRIDRVDIVDDEGQGQGGQDGEQPKDDGDAGRSPDEKGDAAEEMSALGGTEMSSPQAGDTQPRGPRLPLPAAADSSADHAFDFYRHMAGWE